MHFFNSEVVDSCFFFFFVCSPCYLSLLLYIQHVGNICVYNFYVGAEL